MTVGLDGGSSSLYSDAELASLFVRLCHKCMNIKRMEYIDYTREKVYLSAESSTPTLRNAFSFARRFEGDPPVASRGGGASGATDAAADACCNKHVCNVIKLGVIDE